LTTLEDHHGRDGTNAVLRRHARGFVRVKLDLNAHKNRLHSRQSPCLFSSPRYPRAAPPRARRRHRTRRPRLARAIARDQTRDRIFFTYRFELPLVLLRQLINQRRNHSARPAPRRPKIHEHRNVRLQHFRLKRRVRDHGRERAYACAHISHSSVASFAPIARPRAPRLSSLSRSAHPHTRVAYRERDQG